MLPAGCVARGNISYAYIHHLSLETADLLSIHLEEREGGGGGGKENGEWKPGKAEEIKHI